MITIAIRLRYDYDPTTTYRARLLPFDPIRREQKMNISIYCSRVVVVSQSNRTQIVISITSVVVECVVVSSSTTYHGLVVCRIAIVIDYTIRLRSDYDVSRACFHSTRAKKITSIFRRSPVVVASQSYCSRIAIVITVYYT